MKEVDAEYYGYRDEDDGVLVPLETQYEKQGVVICLLLLIPVVPVQEPSSLYMM